MDKIDTTGFALKSKYDTVKSDLENKLIDAEKKIPVANSLVKKIDLNAKITEIGNKMPSITGLTTKISEIEKKVSDHNHDKYINTPELNKLTIENFKARLPQEDLVTKTDFDIKLQDISKRITSNKTKHFLVENELKN